MSYSQSGNIVPSSSGSMFTPSEWALIQAGKWFPELSHFVPVTSPRNLDDNLNHARDEGEKIDLLIHTALNPHAPALIGLGEFLNSRDLTILAATLRGFASIGEALSPKEQKNHPPDYLHHLKQLQYVFTANLDLHDDENPSVHLFKRLCQDAESSGSEMVRWAAAHALQELDYPLNLRRQLLSRPPAEIEAEIWTKYEMRLSESNRQRDPSKVLEDVKFGIYGDIKKLFAKCDTGYSLEIARQVLQKSGVRGIKLAIESRNKPIVQAAINFAGELFNNNRYKDNATRQKLVDLLLSLLNQADFDLQNLAAEKLNDKKNQYEVSNRFIDQNNRAKVAVIDTDWKRAISLGDLAIPILCKTVEGKLIIEKDESLNVNCQIAAVETINKILTDISRKISTLAPYLQHDNHSLRMTVANLLEPHQSRLDAKSSQIMTALLFQLNLSHESNISLSNSQLDESTVENYMELAKTHRQSVQVIFVNATSACESKSISTKNFLVQQQKILIDRIANYLGDLDDWLQKYDDDLEAKEKQKEDERRRQTLCSELSLESTAIQKQIQILNEKIEETNLEKAEYLTKSMKLSSDDKNIFDLLLGYFIGFPLIVLVVWGTLWGLSGYFFVTLTKVMTRDAFDSIFLPLFFIFCFLLVFFDLYQSDSSRSKISDIRECIDSASYRLSILEEKRNKLNNQFSSISVKVRNNQCF